MNTNYRSKIITLIVIVIFVVQARCDKPAQPQVLIHTQVPQVVKDFMAFKEGSYWVYKDSTTGQLDSQYVISYEDRKSDPDREIIIINKQSSIDPGVIDISADPISRQSYCHCTEDVTYGKTYKSSSTISVWIIFPTSDTTIRDSFYSDVVQNVFTNSTLILSGIKFTNIVKTHHINNPVEGNQPENDYFSPHVGLIRKELLGTHHVWNLIRYYIIQ